MMDLNEIKKITLEVGKARIKNGAKLCDGDFLKHCAGEVVEAVQERFKLDTFIAEHGYYDSGSWGDEADKIKLSYSHELADIIICVLNEAEKADIDIEKAILEVIEKNKLRAEGKGDKL
ncbi:MAG: hypothetical protein MJ162_01080 [Treponema sp.]|nr:hypothetical protein [Treponema sp.]